jgi:hypothetical protein
MSSYKTIKTKMTNAAVLKVALEQAKPEWKGHVEAAAEGAKISIRGDSNVQGVLRVPRAKAGTYADIGVVRNKDGSLSWKISDVDVGSYYHDADSREKQGKLFGEKWQKEIEAEYALVEGCAQAQNVGAQIGERTTWTHPQWGKVIGVRCRIKKGAVA